MFQLSNSIPVILLAILSVIFLVINSLNKIIRLKEEQNNLLKELILKFKN